MYVDSAELLSVYHLRMGFSACAVDVTSLVEFYLFCSSSEKVSSGLEKSPLVIQRFNSLLFAHYYHFLNHKFRSDHLRLTFSCFCFFSRYRPSVYRVLEPYIYVDSVLLSGERRRRLEVSIIHLIFHFAVRNASPEARIYLCQTSNVVYFYLRNSLARLSGMHCSSSCC